METGGRFEFAYGDGVLPLNLGRVIQFILSVYMYIYF